MTWSSWATSSTRAVSPRTPPAAHRRSPREGSSYLLEDAVVEEERVGEDLRVARQVGVEGEAEVRVGEVLRGPRLDGRSGDAVLPPGHGAPRVRSSGVGAEVVDAGLREGEVSLLARQVKGDAVEVRLARPHPRELLPELRVDPRPGDEDLSAGEVGVDEGPVVAAEGGNAPTGDPSASGRSQNGARSRERWRTQASPAGSGAGAGWKGPRPQDGAARAAQRARKEAGDGSAGESHARSPPARLAAPASPPTPARRRRSAACAARGGAPGRPIPGRAPRRGSSRPIPSRGGTRRGRSGRRARGSGRRWRASTGGPPREGRGGRRGCRRPRAFPGRETRARATLPRPRADVVGVDGVEEGQVALRRETADELLAVVLEVVADGVRVRSRGTESPLDLPRGPVGEHPDHPGEGEARPGRGLDGGPVDVVPRRAPGGRRGGRGERDRRAGASGKRRAVLERHHASEGAPGDEGEARDAERGDEEAGRGAPCRAS